VDAMGGDHAPEMVVQGAVEAVSELGIDITLVGHEKIVAKALNTRPAHGHISFRHCEDVVEMDESPLKALRRKKDASIKVAFDLVKGGRADAVISAGNSGATLAAGVLALGRMEGVERPAIATIVPTERGRVVLIDVEEMWTADPLTALSVWGYGPGIRLFLSRDDRSEGRSVEYWRGRRQGK